MTLAGKGVGDMKSVSQSWRSGNLEEASSLTLKMSGAPQSQEVD